MISICQNVISDFFLSLLHISILKIVIHLRDENTVEFPTYYLCVRPGQVEDLANMNRLYKITYIINT